MRSSKFVVASLVVLMSVLLVGVLYAWAECGSAGCAGPATTGCAKPAMGGCRMGQTMGSCPMGQPMGACRMGQPMGMQQAVSRALTAGQVTLAQTCRGLQVIVTDLSHQGDPNASVSIQPLGASKPVHAAAKRAWSGHFVVTGDLADAKELAVRVDRAAVSQVVYFGLAQFQAPAVCQGRASGKCASGDHSACKGGAGCQGAKPACPCGSGCKCASGDHSACTCGASCQCGKSK
jgi:hypothetical protein